MRLLAVAVVIVLSSPLVADAETFVAQTQAQREAQLRQRLEALRADLEELRALLEARRAQEEQQSARDFDGRTLAVETPVTASFANAEVGDVLDFLARRAGVMVQFNDGVNKRFQLTFQFDNADFGTVFNYVLDVAYLDARIVGEKTLLIVSRR